jgi:DNA-binding FadR family transcriptional regulator
MVCLPVFGPVYLMKASEGATLQIVRAIRDGRLRVGDRLPAERDMADDMQVSRPTVRTALRVLVEVGVLETRAGAGTFVKSEAIPVGLMQGQWTIRRDSVVGQIVQAIREGRLRVGDRLPAERDIATDMQVSRSTVRTALSFLDQSGVLETRVNGDTFVKSAAIPVGLIQQGAIRSERGRDLLELRRLIETHVAQVAAVYGTEQDYAALASIIEEQREAIEDRERFLRLELQFHVALARGTQNSVTPRIVELVLRQLEMLTDLALRERESFERGISLHERTLDALRSRDPAQVQIAVDNHLAALESAFFSMVGRESLREIPSFLLPADGLPGDLASAAGITTDSAPPIRTRIAPDTTFRARPPTR